MAENATNEFEVQPNTENECEADASTDTTREEVSMPENPDRTIEVKYNKQTRMLSAAEAALLAQKGLKFESLAADIEKLKSLANAQGKNITDYLSDIEVKNTEKRKQELLERCGGDEEIAQKLINFENGNKLSEPIGFEKLKQEFPEIKELSDVPDEVLEQVNLHGGNLFYEYLLYEHKQHCSVENAKIKENESRLQSVGSLVAGTGISPTPDNEFIKGIWS